MGFPRSSLMCCVGPAPGRTRCRGHEVIHGNILGQQQISNRAILGGMAGSKFISPQLTAFQHEWMSHGTCYNTLQPSCLPSGSPQGAEAVAYFQRVVGLFQQLPTYQWLASAGITPSYQQTYDIDSVISALKAASGVRYILPSSAVELIESVHRFPRQLSAPAVLSSRSAITSTSRGHSLMASSSLSVRGMIHNGRSVMLMGTPDSPVESKCPRGNLRYIPKSE